MPAVPSSSLASPLSFPVKISLGLAGIVAIPALWTALASLAFLAGTGLLSAFRVPVWQWWLYALHAPPDRTVRLWLLISGVGAALVPVLLILGPINRRRLQSLRGREAPLVRGDSDNHGHADWLSMQEATQRFAGGASGYGGVVVGEVYRVDQDAKANGRFDPADRASWGQGGKAPLLIDPCNSGPTHSLIIAGAGAFKTTSAVSTLLHWTGSAVVLDPSCELGPMLTRARNQMDHTVVALDLTTARTVGFNALDWIDVRSPLAEANVNAVVSWIFGEQQQSRGGDEFFRNRGKEMVACLLAHMLWDPSIPTADKTLRALRTGVCEPEARMRRLLAGIRKTSHSDMARDLAGSLMEIVAETFSGIYANANEATAWLSVPAYANLVSGSAFPTQALRDGHLSVFVQLPLKTLMATPAIGRVIVGALLNAVYEADGAVTGRVLFMLDEVAQLGRMRVLEQARDAGRKYGITLQLFYQSVGQIVGQWGPDGKRAWYDGVSWRAYAAVQDMDTAKEVSAAAGEYGVVAVSEGDNRGRQGKLGEVGSRSKGQTASRHEIRRALIKPEELTQDVREDELFVIARGTKPLRCGRAIYFRRPEMAVRVDANRFAKVSA